MNREYYTTFNKIQIIQYTTTKTFLLRPQFQPLQPKTSDSVCEMELLPHVILCDCKLIYLELCITLFHKP